MAMMRGVVLAACILGCIPLATSGADVSRDHCVFVDVCGAARTQKVGRCDGPAREVGSGICTVRGVTFDLQAGGVSLRAGEPLVFTTNAFVYAGAKGIEAMLQKDMGPLALYAVPEVYLLHSVTGRPAKRRVGRVVFTYEDGSESTEGLYLGENVGSRETPAKWASAATNGFCVAQVLNPVPYVDIRFVPGKCRAVKSLSLCVTDSNVVYKVGGITCKLGRQRVHN